MNIPTLKQQVLECLFKYSPEAAAVFDSLFSHPDRSSRNLLLELNDLNVFWRHQLGSMPVSTISERQSLLDSVSSKTWLELFERDVVPFLIKHWLPYISKG